MCILYGRTILLAGVLVLTGCATSRHQLAARRVTNEQWDAVRECVILAARASGHQPMVDDFVVIIPAPGRRQATDFIVFRWGPNSVPGYTVRSMITARDLRQGPLEPIEGATLESRRLRQQLDEQCLSSYPIVTAQTGQ